MHDEAEAGASAATLASSIAVWFESTGHQRARRNAGSSDFGVSSNAVALKQFPRRLRKLFQQIVLLGDAITILDRSRIGHGRTGSKRVGRAVGHIRHQQRNLLRRRRRLRQPSTLHCGKMFAHRVDFSNRRSGMHQRAIRRDEIVERNLVVDRLLDDRRSSAADQKDHQRRSRLCLERLAASHSPPGSTPHSASDVRRENTGSRELASQAQPNWLRPDWPRFLRANSDMGRASASTIVCPPCPATSPAHANTSADRKGPRTHAKLPRSQCTCRPKPFRSKLRPEACWKIERAASRISRDLRLAIGIRHAEWNYKERSALSCQLSFNPGCWSSPRVPCLRRDSTA